MTPIKRPLATAGLAAFVGLWLTGCGGEAADAAKDGHPTHTGANAAPTDASKAEFCKAFGDDSWFTAVEEAHDYDAYADGIHVYAAKLEDVGTPVGISAEQRKGFEIAVEHLKGVTGKDMERVFNEESSTVFADRVSKADERLATSFEKYVTESCGEN